MGAPRHDLGWTDERIERLKKLWVAGSSASAIALQLGGGVTRNACIAKIHRLGLSNRATASKPQRAKPTIMPKAPSVSRKQAGISAATRQAAAQGLPVPQLAPPQELAPDPTIAQEPLRISIMELGAHSCRWPLGKVSPFTFCGLRATDGPYCAEHERIARPRVLGTPQRGATELIRSVRRFI